MEDQTLSRLATANEGKMKRDILKVRRDFEAWKARQQLSPEANAAASRVACGLWACANNRPPITTLIAALAEDVATLVRDQRASQ